MPNWLCEDGSNVKICRRDGCDINIKIKEREISARQLISPSTERLEVI